jgi:hypothetical protein
LMNYRIFARNTSLLLKTKNYGMMLSKKTEKQWERRKRKKWQKHNHMMSRNHKHFQVSLIGHQSTKKIN